MRWLSAFSKKVRGTLDRLRQWSGTKVRRRGPRIHYERVEEFPSQLRSATLYVAGDEHYPWAAALLCPCGCGEVIELNLLEQASPCWSVRKNRDGTVTLIPSVWRTKGCQSHFLIRDSRIDWFRLESESTSRRGPSMDRRVS